MEEEKEEDEKLRTRFGTIPQPDKAWVELDRFWLAQGRGAPDNIHTIF